MKKLLVSLASLGTGGAERVLSILSKPLADSFDEIQYVIWEGGEVYYEIDSRIKVVSLPELSGKKGRIHQIRTFRLYVKHEHPDLVLSFLTPYNMLVLLSTLGMNQKIVVAERNDPMYVAGGKPVMLLRDLLYKRAIGILAQTEYAKSCYTGKLNEKTTVIYNPVVMNEDQVGCALKAEKQKLFTSVGSLEPKKDQVVMMDAFSIFSKTHPDYKLVIYGEGRLRNQLETKISELGLSERILLPGTCKSVWKEMAKSECFLLSSTHEGMSNAMIEAMCLGLPVITTKVAGSTDLIKDGTNGFIVELRDADSMAKCMCQLADNQYLRRSVAEEACEVYELLRADMISLQWVKYITKMMEK